MATQTGDQNQNLQVEPGQSHPDGIAEETEMNDLPEEAQIRSSATAVVNQAT